MGYNYYYKGYYTYIMASLKSVFALYENLNKEWSKKPCNLKKCEELLTQLKVNFSFDI